MKKINLRFHTIFCYETNIKLMSEHKFLYTLNHLNREGNITNRIMVTHTIKTVGGKLIQ